METVVICVLLPRFSFIAAAGGPRSALARGPAVLAPEPGGVQVVGEPSPAAETFGIHAGMRLGEALARCPELALIPPDPLAVGAAWEKVLARLESVGAAVESPAPGAAWFDGAALARLHGMTAPPFSVRSRGGSTPPWLPGVLAATAAGLRLSAHYGAGPSRFCAYAGAMRASSRAAVYLDGARALSDESVALLRIEPGLAELVETLQRLGVATLGALVALGRSALAERFGRAGERVHELASGGGPSLTPRWPGERIEESLEMPEAGSGEHLAPALTLLIDRVLARSERRGRTIRSVILGAELVEGGTWQRRVVLRTPTTDRTRIQLALGQQIQHLPALVQTLRLSVEQLGPAHDGARALFEDARSQRRERLAGAVRQVRAVAGPEGALRVIELDPRSRVPERRVALTPIEP